MDDTPSTPSTSSAPSHRSRMKWTIGRKIGLGFLLALAGLLLIGYVAHLNSAAQADARNWVDHTFQVVGVTNEILIAVEESESEQRAFLLTEDPSSIPAFHDAQARAVKKIGEVRALTVDNAAEQQRIGVLESEVSTRVALLQENIEKKKAGAQEAVTQNVIRGKKLMDDMRETLKEMTAAENSLLATRLEEEDKAERRAKMVINLGILTSIVLLGFLSFWIARDIAAPLNAISGAAYKIAGGDFAVALPSGARSDEVGALVRTFTYMASRLTGMAGIASQIASGNLRVEVKPQSPNDLLGNAFLKMVESLRETIGEVTLSTNVLASAASEILASTTQVASGTAETATAVTQTSATVEEVKQTAEISSQKAKYVSESARRAAEVAQTGQKTVDAAILGMGRVQVQMESITESVVRLSEQSHAIGEIIATVNDLAEQSNLLAVNAAIEAAKAGERGRGFTIVAQEIKSLAAQSKQATGQVRSILGEIQKATTASVLATEQGSKAVEAGLKESAEAGEAIRTLAESISEAAQAATQISASSQQQVVGTDQVALAMENIKQASAQNLAGTRQSETAAHSLHELGQKLKQLLERFKV